MIRLAIPILALAVVLAATRPAGAFSLSCQEAADLVLSGDPQSQGVAVGYALGTVDFIAGLLCFIQHPQCDCVANLPRTQPADFGRQFGMELAACVNANGSVAAYGPAARAARAFCEF